MSIFVSDTFTDTAGTTLTSHAGETGATWSETTGFTAGEAMVTAGGRVRSNSASEMVSVASGTPGSADYPVLVDFVSVTSINVRAGLVARWSGGATSSGYMIRFREFQGWQLFRYVGSSPTQLGSTVTPTSMPAGSYRLRLECSGVGATVTVTAKLQRLADGYWLNSSGTFVSGDSAFISVGDTHADRITSTGAAGVTFLGVATDSTGYHLDNFQGGESGGGDATPPTLSSPAIPSGGTTLAATLSESGCTPSSGTGGFTLSGTSATVTSWAISGTTLTLTLSGTVYSGETVTYSYARASTTDDIADAASNYLADFSAAAVTNSSTQTSPVVAGTASFVSSGPSGISVSATAPTGGTGSITYQWERNSNGGSYSDLSGATSATLTDATATAGTLYGYRCKQTRSAVAVTTNAVTAQVYAGGALTGGGGYSRARATNG